MRALCLHCRARHVNRPRGLCWHCYYTPGVREQYPAISKFGRRGAGHRVGAAPLPDAATTAWCGSQEKIAILAERAAAGQTLWHPGDERRRVAEFTALQKGGRHHGPRS